MTSFSPGDRVTDGRYIGFVEEVRGDYAVIKDPRRIMRVPIKMKHLRPAWQECKDCGGDGEVLVGRMEFVRADLLDPCPTCKGTGRKNRTGPYKLQSGKWSDDVDRTIALLYRWRDGVGQVWYSRERGDWVVSGANNTDARFPTFEEAVAYAHEKAKGDKK